ncbi:MAG: hypothetical protein NC311_05055 [Muribaculaceae bacterium]|nr:hypothetical protein [Muribaculaceae bacterium]
MSKGWDNATLKKLKALTGKGLSTSEIGKRLGLSKNAVVGKLNRLGWNSKAASSDAGKMVAADKKAAPKAGAAKKATATTTVATKVTKKPAPKKENSTKVAADKKTASAKKSESVKAVAKADAAKKTTCTKTAAAQKDTTDKKSLDKSLAMHQRIIQHSLEMANLKPNQCRWPIGDPDSEHFHFCGETVFVGKPYCYEHCKQAYQFAPPKKK